MKTTLNLNDQILRAARKRANQDGLTLTRFVEESLRMKLLAADAPRPPFRLELLTVKGTQLPDVDIADRRALYEVLDQDDRG